MNTVKITKMHGCGNDFILIDYDEYEKTGMSMSELAKKICNRHFSIGADGMIIPNLTPDEGDIGWHFYNSDGSTAQMCGNGMRCFAKYLTDNGILTKKIFSVKTGAGIIKPEILDNGLIRVNMSRPITEPSEIPFKGKNNLNQELITDKKIFTVNAISMGNPHCVIFTKDDVYDCAKHFGALIENHEKFPEKTNVEFVNINSKNEITLCVYERGCGITQACGTGACASVAAAVLNNLTEQIVKVNLLGGVVTVDWREKDSTGDIYLIGEAEYSFFADYII